MPELPEVETVLRALEKNIKNKSIKYVRINTPKLRFPLINEDFNKIIDSHVYDLKRRGKYIIIKTRLANNCFDLVLHLGMSGFINFCDQQSNISKHEHLIIGFQDNSEIRLHDTRKFGCALVCQDAYLLDFIKKLGVEPLTKEFNGKYLFEQAQKRRIEIKNLIMNQEIVVGVGNIYATEALFSSKISPMRCANSLDINECNILVHNIKTELKKGIDAGGTTLRDFHHPDGKIGYFQQQLKVYGKANKACPVCKNLIKSEKIAGRSSFFCSFCQK